MGERQKSSRGGLLDGPKDGGYTSPLMFKPDEIIFAPTGRCNLSCAHCRVSRTPGPLSADDAIALLRSARGKGVERVGFSGGEPFLELDFVCAVSAAAVELDYMFDRVMTNAVWWKTEAELRSALERLCEAGFDGIIGVSLDSYHGQDIGRLETFFKTAFDVWGRRDFCEIVWVTSSDDEPLFGLFGNLAERLGGVLVREGQYPEGIGDPAPPDDSGYDDPDALSIPFDRIPFSPPADAATWDAPRWFEEDYCQGPGNVLYVHPDGRIAVCCGFANERDALVVGKLGSDGFETLMERARANEYVRTCYEKGLGSERKRLEKTGVRFPGKTDDPCVFCDYLCARGIR